MKILHPLRPDITASQIEEFSPVATAVNIGNHLTQHGHHVGYVTSISPSRFSAGSETFVILPTRPEGSSIAESFMIYRDEAYDIMHVHTSSFPMFKQLRKYIGSRDRVICTMHAPANIGRSFWYHREDLQSLLELPNFRLVCVSQTGSYKPLMKALGYEHLLDPESPSCYAVDSPPGRIKVIRNGIVDLNIRHVPFNRKINRFMFVAHFMPSKNVVQTLQMAVENRIPCLFVGRRLPVRRLLPSEEAYAVRCDEMIAQNRDIIDYRPCLSYHECVQEMAYSRCLVVFSDIESFGFTPVEAAQVGTPTVWLACQGIDETMLETVTGFRISRKQERNWKLRRQRASELYHRVILLDQYEMSKHVRENFSIGACARNYEMLYNEFMNA